MARLRSFGSTYGVPATPAVACIASLLGPNVQEQSGNARIRLLLLEVHALFRVSLARLLAAERDFEVMGDCGSTSEALAMLHSSSIDVVLLDLDLGVNSAADVIALAMNSGFQGRFLIVTESANAERAALALKLGASGIFLKSDVPERLVQAIRLITAGGVWVDQKVIQLLAEQCLDPPRRAEPKRSAALDNREQAALQGILSGLTNRDIASILGTSESSVKNILQGLFGRTGVRKRSQLVRLAVEGALGDLHEMTKLDKV